LFRWLADNGINPAKGKLIMNGTEIITLSACGVTLKDSKCFIPMALARVPGAFGFEEEAKGFFPYLFDTPERADYVGPWPETHYYNPDSMMPPVQKAFNAWYSTVKDKVCDFLLTCILLFL
jgi:hypothetical protein